MTQQQKDDRDTKIKELIKDGLTVAQIVKEVGCSNSTVLDFTQPKHNIGSSNITHNELTPEIKSSIGVMIELFKNSLDIPEFVDSIDLNIRKAISSLEAIIDE